MCGQLDVTLIPTSAIPEFFDRVECDGFLIDVDAGVKSNHQFIHCMKLRYDISVQVYSDPKDDGQTFAVVPYPPYSCRPWHWPREQKLFDELTSHLDHLESRVES